MNKSIIISLCVLNGADINECAETENVCGENYDCFNNKGSFSCQCVDGFFEREGSCGKLLRESLF